MNADARDERNNVSLEQIKQQLGALCAVEPPRGLKEKLLAAIPRRALREAAPAPVARWPGATGWVGLAATIVVVCAVAWLRIGPGPSASPSSDANGSPGRVLAADYNGVHPSDINALDSNSLY